MLYRKERTHTTIPGGYFHLEEEKTKVRVFGYGHGDHIKLTDEYGNVWRGSAQRMDTNAVAYRFRDSQGRTITGTSDSFGVILRDERGNIWKGFID